MSRTAPVENLTTRGGRDGDLAAFTRVRAPKISGRVSAQ
jgi:hypothetical protein